ncbi:hypothetical protein KCP73_08530 [Salmonella enterica subsp. enterica]|nr:hypothetical protein KCP73_08530 [Salmonella enterica subsp. enterica]
MAIYTLLFRRQTNWLISFAPPAPYWVSTVPALGLRVGINYLTVALATARFRRRQSGGQNHCG